MSSDSIFDYVNSITHNKKDLMRGTDNDELAEKNYNPFITNRALSYHIDTVLYANEMNLRSHVDNLLQHDYLINSIRPGKRFSKWAKPVNNAELEDVMEFYGYGREKALQALKLLTPDQITMIHERLDKGGIKNDKHRRNGRGASKDR